MPGGVGPGGSGHSPGMMGGDMPRMMQMMQMMQTMHRAMSRNCMAGGGLAGMSPFAHIEGQIAFYKAELGITDAQRPQWDALVEVVRATAKALQQAYMPPTQPGAPVSAPELIDRRVALVAALLEAMKAMKPPFQALYAVLSDEQKKKADELMAEHLQAMQASGL
jgi:LTXXQ motif family protein